jgi:RNA polymerase sigma factor for flagellar operon FliA
VAVTQGTTTFPDDLAELWQEYRQRDSPEARERLILHYAPLVKYVAGRIAGGFPDFVERGDLVSSGVFGLIDAVERFDPDRGARFETYALLRIRGAILDELRLIDWVPRSVRSMARQIEQAQQDLESELQRPATDEEVAGRLDVHIDDVRTAMRQVGESAVLGLDYAAGEADEGPGSILYRVSRFPGEPYQTAREQEQRVLVVESINQLDARERLVVTLYYYGGLTLADIGEVLGLSEARVCQMRGHAIERLRSLIAS